jgi:hypothetical protein
MQRIVRLLFFGQAMYTLHKASKRKFGLLIVVTCLQIVTPTLFQERSLLSAELGSEFSETGWINSREWVSPLGDSSQTISDLPVKGVATFDSFVANSEVPVEHQTKHSDNASNGSSSNSSTDSEPSSSSYLIYFLILLPSYLLLFLVLCWCLQQPAFRSMRSDSYKREDERHR